MHVVANYTSLPFQLVKRSLILINYSYVQVRAYNCSYRYNCSLRITHFVACIVTLHIDIMMRAYEFLFSFTRTSYSDHEVQHSAVISCSNDESSVSFEKLSAPRRIEM